MNKTSAAPTKKGAKGKAALTLCLILIITVAAGLLGFNGMPLDSRGLYKLLPWLPTANVEAWPKVLPLGLDLQGGVYVEYQAVMPEDSTSDYDGLMASTISVIQSRLTQKGYPESTVVRLGNDGIRVEIPAVSDPNEILTLIGSPAKLEFVTPEGEIFKIRWFDPNAVPGVTASESLAPAGRSYVHDVKLPWQEETFSIDENYKVDFYTKVYEYVAEDKPSYVPVEETLYVMELIKRCREFAEQ